MPFATFFFFFFFLITQIELDNQVVDILSWKEEYVLCMLTHIHSNKINGSICNITRERLQKDPLAKVVDLAKVRKTRQFWIEGDLRLTRGNKFYVLREEKLRKKLMHECKILYGPNTRVATNFTPCKGTFDQTCETT